MNRANYESDPVLERLLAVVPFGVPDSPPAERDGPAVLKGVLPGVERDDAVVLWSGGMWNWVDPLTLVRATAKLREDPWRRQDGDPRPRATRIRRSARLEMARRARTLSDELGLTGAGVTFVGLGLLRRA